MISKLRTWDKTNFRHRILAKNRTNSSQIHWIPYWKRWLGDHYHSFGDSGQNSKSISCRKNFWTHYRLCILKRQMAKSPCFLYPRWRSMSKSIKCLDAIFIDFLPTSERFWGPRPPREATRHSPRAPKITPRALKDAPRGRQRPFQAVPRFASLIVSIIQSSSWTAVRRIFFITSMSTARWLNSRHSSG